MKTLIVGAGIAGMTLAALLRQRDEYPVIIERAAGFGDGGYNLALYPLGSRVLHGLRLFDRFLESSVPCYRYQLFNGHGELVHDFDFGSLRDQYGPIQGIRRRELLEILSAGADGIPVHFGIALTGLEDRGEKILATFSDRSTAEFDLVVAADGMHSETRPIILGQDEFAYWESGWACWLAWAPGQILPPATSAEFWGAGRLIGVYPVKDANGVVLAGPAKLLSKEGRTGFMQHIGKHFGMFEGQARAALQAISGVEEAFFWDLHDCRTKFWSKGRVVLLGDAAAGFLPTAGIGASMAMLSAAALADELSRADAGHVEYALRLFERRNRKRVEAAQDTSRRLARIMMIDSLPMAWGRDQLVKLYTFDRALKDAVDLMEGSS
ncbi:MAG: FAD-dependent oxidoreductase [Candidatus Binataceae bacterium]